MKLHHVLDTVAILVLLVDAWGLVGCPPSPPAVTPPPDASDAAPAPAPLSDAAAGSCQSACAAMAAAGCVVLPDCAAVLAQTLQPESGVGLVRNAVTGRALTCADLAATHTAAGFVALGQKCGAE
jgi:hypothetical protein